MFRHIWEALKTAIIVLLLLSILLLTLMALPAGVVSSLSLPRFLTAALGLPYAQAEVEETPVHHAAAAVPMMISIRQSGGRATIRRDPAAMNESYNRFSSYLSSGLHSAAGGEEYTGDWSFLNDPGVLFLYEGSIPAQALCQWLNEQERAVADIAGGYLLSCSDGAVSLYTINGSCVRRYTTTVSHDELLALLSEYTPDGTEFAFAREGSTVAPLTLWETSVILPDCAASNPVTQEFSRKLATELDFNPYGAGTYTDPDGSTTYTEIDRSLTVKTDGSIAFTLTGDSYPRFQAASAKASDLIEAAGKLLDIVFSDTPEDAVISLCGFHQEEDLTVLSYRYTINGVPVYPSCGEVVFRGSALTGLTCTLRSFELRSSVSVLMPLPQAAVIAEPGKQLIPAYDLSASGTLTTGWRVQ